uniref:Uncharacterized protein n=1 Tax=Meloidogyne floridensis TaxID=298350 RepID=A0A915P656_9BILA
MMRMGNSEIINMLCNMIVQLRALHTEKYNEISASALTDFRRSIQDAMNKSTHHSSRWSTAPGHRFNTYNERKNRIGAGNNVPMLRNRASVMILILESLISTMKKITEAEYQGIKSKDLNALRTETNKLYMEGINDIVMSLWEALERAGRNSLGNDFNALLGQKNAIGPVAKPCFNNDYNIEEDDSTTWRHQARCIISLWNRSSDSAPVTNRIRETLRRVLNLPSNAILEYKRHDDCLKDQRSYCHSTSIGGGGGGGGQQSNHHHGEGRGGGGGNFRGGGSGGQTTNMNKKDKKLEEEND